MAFCKQLLCEEDMIKCQCTGDKAPTMDQRNNFTVVQTGELIRVTCGNMCDSNRCIGKKLTEPWKLSPRVPCMACRQLLHKRGRGGTW